MRQICGVCWNVSRMTVSSRHVSTHILNEAQNGTIWFVKTLWHTFFHHVRFVDFSMPTQNDNCINWTNWSVSEIWLSFRINSMLIARSHSASCKETVTCACMRVNNNEIHLWVRFSSIVLENAMSFSASCVCACHINLLCQFCLKINERNFGG